MTPEVIAVTKDNDTTCFSPEISLTTQRNLHACVCVQMIVTNVLCCSIGSRLGQTIKHQRKERRSTERHLHMVLRDCTKRNKPVRKTIGTHRAEQSGGGQHPKRRPWGLLNTYLQLGDLTWLNNNENVLNVTNLYTKK